MVSFFASGTVDGFDHVDQAAVVGLSCRAALKRR